MKKTSLFEKDIVKIAYCGINRNVQALYKAAESVKATILESYEGEDFVSELQSRMASIKRELLNSQYNSTTDITGDPIIDNMLLDIKQFDFSRLNEIEIEGDFEYKVVYTKIPILKYMIATQLDSEEVKHKAEEFIDNKYFKLNISEFEKSLKDLISFSDFAFNEFLDNFFCLHLKEEAIKYYLEALYIAVNQLEDMVHVYNHAKVTTIDFLLTEAIKYAEFMIDKE